MKIMSYIQKIFAVLFLSLLAVSCTDEMIDHGGSTTPIEEGKLVDVKFMLDQAGTKTVVTKSDHDNDPEVDDELLFLQYKDGNLVHAWYTEEDDDITNIKGSSDKKENDFEGEGVQGTVHIQLLSGEGYHVYVIANLELDDDYYTSVSFEKDDDDDDDERGIVDITNSKFSNEFGTEGALLNWKRNSSNFIDDDDKDQLAFEYDKDKVDLDDDPVMFAVTSNTSMGETSVYRYTKMATNFDIEGDRVNDMIGFTDGIPSVSISESSTICATLYPPYAKIALKIEAKNLKKEVKINSVKVVNCPLDYSLVNGFNLANAGGKTTTHTFGKKDIFKGEKLEKEKNKSLNESFNNPIYVFENMAGTADKKDPLGNGSKEASLVYTYIQVDGSVDGEDITYRFILGKTEEENCNVERNVFYKVTMTLTGNAGINESSWRVIYNGNTGEDKTPSVSAEGLSRLDAHATVTPITFNNLKAGTYSFVIENGNGSIKNHGGNLYSVKGDNATIKNGSTGNNFEFEVEQFQDKVVINYLQDGWFDDTWNNSQGHNKDKPAVVAAEGCNEYTVNVYYGKDKQNPISSITIKQYPPIVVYQDPIIDKNDEPVTLDRWSNVTYMERFDDDHDAVPTNYNSWVFPDFSQQNETLNYPQRLFDKNEKGNSEVCYWLNPYGPLDYKKNGTYSKIGKASADAWEYSLKAENTQRYIVQMAI